MTIRSGFIAYIFSFLCLYFFSFMYDLRFQLPVFPGAWSWNYERLLYVMLQTLECSQVILCLCLCIF
jgi:hypothetical protein